ncbi:hypothetical protein ACT7CZ_27530 [Bacillus cereus]
MSKIEDYLSAFFFVVFLVGTIVGMFLLTVILDTVLVPLCGIVIVMFVARFLERKEVKNEY